MTEQDKAKKVFEAIQLSRGQTNFSKTANGKYINPAIQVRWNYFKLGWEMAKVSA
jgi:hypothetical protein